MFCRTFLGAPPALNCQYIACRSVTHSCQCKTCNKPFASLQNLLKVDQEAYAKGISSKNYTIAPSILVPLQAAAAHEYAANSRTLKQAKGQQVSVVQIL